VNLVPEITYDGYETTLPIAPAGDRGLDDLVPDYMREEGYYADGQRDNAAHYMRITLGGFDILNVSLEREGNNLTYATPAGGMVSNGHGILGLLTRQRASIGCPTRANHDLVANITDQRPFAFAACALTACAAAPDPDPFAAGDFDTAFFAAPDFAAF
jgi:hypothetical protein